MGGGGDDSSWVLSHNVNSYHTPHPTLPSNGQIVDTSLNSARAFSVSDVTSDKPLPGDEARCKSYVPWTPAFSIFAWSFLLLSFLIPFCPHPGVRAVLKGRKVFFVCPEWLFVLNISQFYPFLYLTFDILSFSPQYFIIVKHDIQCLAFLFVLTLNHSGNA